MNSDSELQKLRYDNRELREASDRLVARIEALEAALRAVVDDIHEYERINQLAPSPGKTECWQSVAHAMTLLDPGIAIANRSSPPKAST